jgi:hypothetical protein
MSQQFLPYLPWRPSIMCRETRKRNAPIASISAALEAFILEHEYCGELDADVETDRVWMTCTCGAAINRQLEGLGKET